MPTVEHPVRVAISVFTWVLVAVVIEEAPEKAAICPEAGEPVVVTPPLGAAQLAALGEVAVNTWPVDGVPLTTIPPTEVAGLVPERVRLPALSTAKTDDPPT